MRKNLKIRNGQRLRFKGIFDGYGLKSSFGHLPKQTLLLIDVENTQGDIVTNHLWFNLTKGFDALGDLYPGDVVAFNARVKPYQKGYSEEDWEVDYKLSHPTKIELLSKAERSEERYEVCECGYRNLLNMLPPRARAQTKRYTDSTPRNICLVS